jgi:small subunit ribosomal protein S4
MILKKRNTKFKPLYKKLINLRENVLNRKKVLKFDKKKWAKFLHFYKGKLKWYRKFKPNNQDLYVVSKHPNKYTAYKKNFKNTLQAYKALKIFLGNTQKKILKNTTFKAKNNKSKNTNRIFIELLEKRLDVILYRSKFCHSIRNAQQFISQKRVIVNNKIIQSKSYNLKKGDLISIKPKYSKQFEFNIKRTNHWPIPPKHLIINYKTMQIVFGDIKNINTSTLFLFNLNLEKVLVDLNKQ